jgi:hypothetical protein
LFEITSNHFIFILQANFKMPAQEHPDHNVVIIFSILIPVILALGAVEGVRAWKETQTRKDFTGNTGRKLRYVAVSVIIAMGKWIALLIMGTLVGFSLFSFIDAFYKFYTSSQNFRADDDFVKELLKAIEYLFLAPIPRVVVLSFENIKSPLTEEVARKMFISSIIAVFATFLVEEFVVQFDQLNEATEGFVGHPQAGGLLFLFLIMFIALLIYFFKILSEGDKGKG